MSDFLRAKNRAVREALRLRSAGGARSARAGGGFAAGSGGPAGGEPTAAGARFARAGEGRPLALRSIPSFRTALTSGAHVAVIAEFKRRSPSAGALPEAGEPAEAARVYAGAGAAAMSVLTDGPDFGGSLGDLAAAAGAAELPLLRKDFIVDGSQLAEARAAGASAALLIVGMLEPAELRELLAAAEEVGIECLTEVHDEAELDTAVEAGATLIGINHRDLRTLTTDLAVSERLAPRAPASAVLVAESGIRTPDDVRRVRDAGCHAILVGESLMRLAPPARAEAVQALAGVPR